MGFRTRDECEPWIQNDQLQRLGKLLDPKARTHVDEEVEAELRDAFDFAETSPFPPDEELMQHVFRER